MAALQLRLDGQNFPRGDTIGDRVTALRKRRDCSQKTLANLVNVSVPTIRALEKNMKGYLATLDKILSTLGAVPFLTPSDAPMSFFSNTGLSSTHHGWQTPPHILEGLYSVFGTFDLDPCSPTKLRSHALVKARLYYTLEDDGLTLPWNGTVFMNPPYGRALPQWVAKAAAEVAQGHANMVIGLIPARTDTKWWHTHIVGQSSVLLLKGRLAFTSDKVDLSTSAPFASALVIWGGTLEALERLRATFRDAWFIPA